MHKSMTIISNQRLNLLLTPMALKPIGECIEFIKRILGPVDEGDAIFPMSRNPRFSESSFNSDKIYENKKHK